MKTFNINGTDIVLSNIAYVTPIVCFDKDEYGFNILFSGGEEYTSEGTEVDMYHARENLLRAINQQDAVTMSGDINPEIKLRSEVI